MQVADLDSPPRTVSVVGPSLALDLSWAAYAAVKLPLRASHPVLTELYENDSELAERVRRLWTGGPVCVPELEVLAQHAGALEVNEFGDFRRAAEAALASVPDDMPLRSETPGDRESIHARLAALRSSSARRCHYFDVLGEVWRGIEGWWLAEGAPAAARAADDARRQLADGRDWTQVATASECEVLATQLPEIIDRHRQGLPVVLAACALFGRGLYLDLPGCVLIGFGGFDAGAQARARTGPAVRRLRALADPTRLAIFDHLGGGPSSIGELARVFSLAQPTVSAHVKHLREVGLVLAERRGTRVEVAVDRAASRRLAEELAILLNR